MRTDIATVRIHPSIGIGRVGNSPTEFFFGPETPGRFVPPGGGFKDPERRVKRQAVRFRLFGYDASGKSLGELTVADGEIAWTVHLANKKASWREFKGLSANEAPRNASVTNRAQLVIDPGARVLRGASQSATFDTGRFLDRPVSLGEARTDDAGRLIVLGGMGQSESVPPGAPITTFANNDGWHDDTSDGPITATFTPTGAMEPIPVMPAWYVCAPPDFAPAVTNVITLYDLLFQLAVDRGWVSPPAKPSFTRDVYPILSRALAMRSVSAMVAPQHASLSGVFGPNASASARFAVFSRLRNPALDPSEESEADMPMLWSDRYPDETPQPLLRWQYRILEQWNAGDFADDWRGEPSPAPTTLTPEGLDRASLEACVGGAFYPGIEVSWLLRDRYEFLEPFRLSHAGIDAGDVTKQMAVPWQADFYQCQEEGESAWWPGQRPDAVRPARDAELVPWTRDIVSNEVEMVERWHRLGFVVPDGDQLVERERDPGTNG